MSSVLSPVIVSWEVASNPDFEGYLTLTSVQTKYDVHATFLVNGGVPHISVRECAGTSVKSPELNSKPKLLQVQLAKGIGDVYGPSMVDRIKLADYCGTYLTGFLTKINEKQRELFPLASTPTSTSSTSEPPPKDSQLKGISTWAGKTKDPFPTLADAAKKK
jgi:hypothetical protein